MTAVFDSHAYGAGAVFDAQTYASGNSLVASAGAVSASTALAGVSVTMVQRVFVAAPGAVSSTAQLAAASASVRLQQITAQPAAVSAAAAIAVVAAIVQPLPLIAVASVVSASAAVAAIQVFLQGPPLTAYPLPVAALVELGLVLARIVLPPEPAQYTSRTEMEKRFSELSLVQLTDRLGTGQIDADVLKLAIVDAGTLIDGKLMARYAVPFAATPPLIEQLASDIAFYRLHTNPPKEVSGRYDNALRLLDSMANGSITLGMEQPPVALDVQFSNGRERVFGRGMGGF